MRNLAFGQRLVAYGNLPIRDSKKAIMSDSTTAYLGRPGTLSDAESTPPEYPTGIESYLSAAGMACVE